METKFDDLADALVRHVAQQPAGRRSLFLLAYAQRLSRMFDLYAVQLDEPGVRFEALLDDLWALAQAPRSDSVIGDSLLAIIPDEEWRVDGFHDALAQYVGGLAYAAWEGLGGAGGIDGLPEQSVFDLIRTVASEMRLGCLEPGSDSAGATFEANLHADPLVVEEIAFWRSLETHVSAGPDVAAIRAFARANELDPTSLEPDLSRGLEKDRLEAQKPW